MSPLNERAYTCTHVRVVQSILEVGLESGHNTLAVAMDTTERRHVLVLCQHMTGLHVRPAANKHSMNVYLYIGREEIY